MEKREQGARSEKNSTAEGTENTEEKGDGRKGDRKN
jgi:hypothetical protein